MLINTAFNTAAFNTAFNTAAFNTAAFNIAFSIVLNIALNILFLHCVWAEDISIEIETKNPVLKKKLERLVSNERFNLK